MPCSTSPRTLIAKCSAFLVFLSAILFVADVPKVRAQPPADKGNPPELKLRWETTLKDWKFGSSLHFDVDATQLVLLSRQGIGGLSFNAQTGKPGAELKHGPELPFGTPNNVFPLPKGKITFQLNVKEIPSMIVWDMVTGKVSKAGPYPTLSAGVPSLQLSPDTRYGTVWETKVKDNKIVESPVMVCDMKTGKPLLKREWKTGQSAYTADGSRVVFQEGNHFQWYKLPSGQPDEEWKFEPESGAPNTQLLGMSADGGVLLCTGTILTSNSSFFLVNGKSGAVLHSFPTATYAPHSGYVSPSGDMVVLTRWPQPMEGLTIDILDAKGTCLGQIKQPMATRFPTATVSWEGRAIATFDPGSKKLSVFNLPGGSGGATIVSRPAGRDTENSNRAPIPSDATLAKAEATIRQVLKDDYAKKTPAELKAFAQKLIKLAGETADDQASRYVMLRDARDFAQGVADPALTLQAIDGLAKWYQIDGPVQQLASLEKILAASAIPATAKLIAEAATASAQAASDVDELDEAVDFAKLAVNAAKKAKFTAAAIDEAESNLTQAKKSRDAFATIRPALEKVKSMPDDPVANLVVGKYRCFIQNRWDDGLKHLSKGEDAALKVLAEVDLKAPRTGAIEDSKLADAWWEYAQSAPVDVQWAAQVRTRYWYGRCIPSLTGLNKARAEGRLVITVGGVEYRPGLLCELAAKQPAVLKGKKARIDSVIDFTGGDFADGAKSTDLTLKWTGVLAAPRGGHYTLVAQTTNPVKVRVDGKLVIDTTIGGAAAKKEASVLLAEKAVPITVEFFCQNVDRHKIKLAWVMPGGTAEEAIPADCLFHDRKTEAALGK